MNDKVTSLFGGNSEGTGGPLAAVTPPKTYTVQLKDGPVLEDMTGYLSINGLFAVLTDTPNDAMAVNFYALLEDIKYIVESDEVHED
jgi:hypothetical protein